MKYILLTLMLTFWVLNCDAQRRVRGRDFTTSAYDSIDQRADIKISDSFNAPDYNYDNLIEFTNSPLGTGSNSCNVRSVVLVNGIYYLYAEVQGTDWYATLRTSTDGLHWSDASDSLLASTAENSHDGTADPTVIYDGVNDWKMWVDVWYDGKGWDSLGYATSTDGISWTYQGAVFGVGSGGSWDDVNVHHPCCLKYDGVYYLYYGGSERSGLVSENIGLATSTDGINFTKYASNPIIEKGTSPEFDYYYIRPAEPIRVDSLWYMYYWGFDSTYHRMGVAVSDDLYSWTKLDTVIYESTVEGEYVASSFLVTEGIYPKDKIVNVWTRSFTESSLIYGSFSNEVVSGATRLGGFTTSADYKYGDSTPDTGSVTKRLDDYIYFMRVTVSDTMIADAIKGYISNTSKPSAAGDSTKCALYYNTSDTPDTLIVESEVRVAQSIIGNEWTIWELESSQTLLPDDYWIAIWSKGDYYTNLEAGGANNWGNKSLTYTGDFPDPVSATTNQAYNNIDFHIIDTKTNVWQVDLTTFPKSVYFNGVKGIRQTNIANLNAEFEWCWVSNILYIYSESHPDVRYQLSYK